LYRPVGGGHYDVVDGQQRLITLSMILGLLRGELQSDLDDAARLPLEDAAPIVNA